MTSLQTRIKQNEPDKGYYINVGNLVGRVLAYNGTSTGPAFSTVAWSNTLASVANANGALPSTGVFTLSSLVTAGGTILKDMGKTVVSSLRTFRKIQVMLPGTNSTLSTFGVGGPAGASYPGPNDYFTGYIELGFEGAGAPAPVAQYGR
jgi:hypothetical protein